MKNIFVMGLFLMSNCALAADSLNLAIPMSPGQYQSDHIRAENIECSMAIGSGTTLEFGVLGIANNNGQSVIGTDPNTNLGKQVGVYGRLIIPIGGPKARLNCDTLYQLELKKKRMEVEKLEAELENLRRLKFENPTK